MPDTAGQEASQTDSQHVRFPKKLTRRARSTSPPSSSPSGPTSDRVTAHQVHPLQPSPSPAQLNNPFVYAAPPPASGHHRIQPGFPALNTPPSLPARPDSTEPSLYGSHASPLYSSHPVSQPDSSLWTFLGFERRR
jgi:hypothetical protein